MGMRESNVLLQVELPNALPLILGGIRSATLQVIATATIAAYVSLGGLGRFVIDGNNSGAGSPDGYPQMAAGAIMIAVLALVVEGVLELVAADGGVPGPAQRGDPQAHAHASGGGPTPDLVN